MSCKRKAAVWGRVPFGCPRENPNQRFINPIGLLYTGYTYFKTSFIAHPPLTCTLSLPATLVAIAAGAASRPRRASYAALCYHVPRTCGCRRRGYHGATNPDRRG